MWGTVLGNPPPSAATQLSILTQPYERAPIVPILEMRKLRLSTYKQLSGCGHKARSPNSAGASTGAQLHPQEPFCSTPQPAVLVPVCYISLLSFRRAGGTKGFSKLPLVPLRGKQN